MRSTIRRRINYSEAIQVGLDDRRQTALSAHIELRNAHAPEEPVITAATAHFAAVLMLADPCERLSSPAALAEAETLVAGEFGNIMERLTTAMLDLEKIGRIAHPKESERVSIARILRHIAARASDYSRAMQE